MSKTEKVKQYLIDNPDAPAAEVSKKCKVSVPYVYVIRSQMKKRRYSMAKNDPAKKIIVPPKADGVDLDAVHKKDTPQVTHYAMEAKMPIVMLDKPHDPVNNPEHYTDGGIETIDFIESKRLGYHLGNVVKYISRAGKKGTNNGLEDLRKAQWYLARAIEKNEINVSR